jgi:hypothetical protein
MAVSSFVALLLEVCSTEVALTEVALTEVASMEEATVREASLSILLFILVQWGIYYLLIEAMVSAIG